MNTEIKENKATPKKSAPKQPAPKSLGAQITKETTKEEAKEPSKEVLAAIKLLESEGYKVTKPKPVGQRNPRVQVKAKGVQYSKLTDALRANGFDVQGDWIVVRKGLKDSETKKFTYKEVEFELA